MNKKQTKASVGTLLTALIMVAIAVIILKWDRQFKIDGVITAAQIDISDIISRQDDSQTVEEKISSVVNYLKENGINTAIVTFNNGNKSIVPTEGYEYIYSENAFFDKQDIIKQLKNNLTQAKIQLYLSVDCQELSQETVLETAKQICKRYTTAGIVLNNYSGEKSVLQQVKSTIGKSFKNIDLILQTDDVQQIKECISLGSFDTFICENLDSDEYTDLKQNDAANEKLLIHYSTVSMESDIFVLTNFSSFDGAVITEINSEHMSPVYLSAAFEKSENLPMFNLSVSSTFTVTNPTSDTSTYYSGIFVTGTGEKYGKVTINDVEYPSARDGTFGVYVKLEDGDNVINISQGRQSKTVTVTKKVSSSSSSYKMQWDDTEYLTYGHVVETTGYLTSVLSDADDDSAIIAGLDQGTKLIVTESVETARNGKKTYAYKLSNGAYILANKVNVLNEITADYKPNKNSKEDINTKEMALFTLPVISKTSIANLSNSDEEITFYVNNMPATIHQFENGHLTIKFLDTSAENLTLPDSSFYTSYSVEQSEDGLIVDFVLNENNPLWGYDISTKDGQTVLYLKHTPKITSKEKPLTGITVMLDAGHGDYDSGTVGVAAQNGPVEKDINLAVAQATKVILEQYGANVIMTRDDDTFLTLDERRNLVRSEKPDFFIAVHHNSMDYSYDSTNAKGSECYYFTSQSRTLAELMCENITDATGRINRGAKNGYYYVTRTDIAPSVLMEYSYLINPEEFSQTYSDADIYKAAFGTVQAVIRTLTLSITE